MYRHFSYRCVILLLAACSNRKQDPLAFTLPVFPETVQVTVTPASDDFLLGGAFSMDDMGEFFIVRTFINNHFLHIYKKEPLTYIKSFCSYGQGPGELIAQPKIRINNDNSELYLFHYLNGGHDLWRYNVENVLQDEGVMPVKQEKIVLFRNEGSPYPGHGSNFLVWKDKRLFAGSFQHRLEVQDTLGNRLDLYDNYPEVPYQDTIAFKGTYATRSTLALKPDLSRFVIATSVGCIMEIFTVDASGKIEKEIEKRFIPPVYKAKRGLFDYINGQTINGIFGLSVTDELIMRYIAGEYTCRRIHLKKRVLLKPLRYLTGRVTRFVDIFWIGIFINLLLMPSAIAAI